MAEFTRTVGLVVFGAASVWLFGIREPGFWGVVLIAFGGYTLYCIGVIAEMRGYRHV